MPVPVLAIAGAAKPVANIVSGITNAFSGKLVYGLKEEEFAQRLTNERWFRYAYANGYTFAGEIPVGMSIGEFFFQLFGYYFTTYENTELKNQTGANYGYNFMFNPNTSPMGIPHSWSAEKMDNIIQAYWKPTPQQMLRLDPVTSPYYKAHKKEIDAVIGEPKPLQTVNAGFGGSWVMILALGGLFVAVLVFRK